MEQDSLLDGLLYKKVLELVGNRQKVLLAMRPNGVLVYKHVDADKWCTADLLQRWMPENSKLKQALNDILVASHLREIEVNNFLFKRIVEGGDFLGVVLLAQSLVPNQTEALLRIVETVALTEGFERAVIQIATILEEQLKTPELYVALFDEELKSYYYPYFRDSKTDRKLFEQNSMKQSFTNFVRIKGEALLIQKEELPFYGRKFGIHAIGEPAESWMCVPIKHGRDNIGVLTVQTYKPGHRFLTADLSYLEKVAEYVTAAYQLEHSYVEIVRHKELLEMSNAISHTVTFEYCSAQNEFFVIGSYSHLLDFPQKQSAYSFEQFSSLFKANDTERLHKDFIKLSKGSISRIDYELETQQGDKIFKLIAKHRKTDSFSLRVIGLLQDITDSKTYEVELRKAFENARNANLLKSEFMSALSYEVRTPINAIIGFSNLLTHADEPDSERAQYYRIIEQNGRALIKLIDDVVDISRLESGEVTIHKTPVDLIRLVDKLYQFHEGLRIQHNKKYVELATATEATGNIVLLDEHRITQVLNILIDNAIQYTHKGFVQFGYQFVSERKPLLRLFVKDTGSGIPESKRDVLFKRYGQIDGNRIKRPGVTSLGLSIANDLVRLMGGYIDMHTEEGKGTEFSIYLAYESAEEYIKHGLQHSSDVVPVSDKATKVLVAEDEKHIFRLVQAGLKLLGGNYDLDFSDNGFDAIEKFRENDYDLILMDLKMPLMDGMRATDYIRNKFQAPKNTIPIIALTANVQQDIKQVCLKHGFDAFISKPFLPDELHRTIHSVLGKRM